MTAAAIEIGLLLHIRMKVSTYLFSVINVKLQIQPSRYVHI